ncbi:MAG: InlB B-repeat-containing protein [Candidatus Coproplasma sp.]
MKKGLTALTSVVLAIITSFSMLLAGCFGGNSNDKDTTPKEYIIQYADDVGTHQLTVTAGMPYSIESVPVKNGYEFLGLFDAEVGGTQYVSANGSSLSAFTDGKNMVLFPQFKAVEYTVILDYQGADITGSRQYNVSYGSSLPELPKNVTLDHSVFAGWYTQPNCGGVQVADKYGLVPVISVLNEKNFDLSGEYVYLYAGFETEKFTVTFCFESGMNTEDVQVEYNTPISEVVPATRVDGKAVLTWSKSQGGEVWNGKVTDNIVLYAVEYAPIIDFDSNGGDEITPVVARAGSTVSLPTPTKDLAKFLYWEDMSGNKYTATTMPSASISLKAVWQAKIVFDENGGSDVSDISVATDNTITLPTPEKEGYIFAGWYTAEKEQYTSTKMPTAGIALKAGWYKLNEALIVQCSADNRLGGYDETSTTMKNGLTIDFSKYLSDDFYGTIKLEAQFKAYHSDATLANQKWINLYFYSTSTLSDSYKLWEENFIITSKSYESFSYSLTTAINGNKLYGAIKVSTYYGNAYISDYRINLTYPDTSYLYI